MRHPYLHLWVFTAKASLLFPVTPLEGGGLTCHHFPYSSVSPRFLCRFLLRWLFLCLSVRLFRESAIFPNYFLKLPVSQAAPSAGLLALWYGPLHLISSFICESLLGPPVWLSALLILPPKVCPFPFDVDIKTGSDHSCQSVCSWSPNSVSCGHPLACGDSPPPQAPCVKKFQAPGITEADAHAHGRLCSQNLPLP